MEQRALGDVSIDTVAVPPRGTVAVRELTMTGSFVDVGFDPGLAVAFGAAVGFLVAAAVGVVVAAAVDVVGDAAVSDADDASGPPAPRPANPSAAGGALGAGSAPLLPNDDPIAAAMITIAIRMPIHVFRPQPALALDAGGPVVSGATLAGDSEAELESEV
jgi:hypothetical protein